jgi:hypothetical protein
MNSMRQTQPVAALDARAFYIETSLPPELTLAEYRRRRPRRSRRRTPLLRSLAQLAGLVRD